MKIERKYRKDLNAWRWGFDVTILGQRIRRYDWLLKRDAQDAIAALQSQARAIRYGLVMPEPTITLDDLFSKLDKDRAARHKPGLLAHFEEFLEIVGPDLRLKTLSRSDWKRYLDELHARDLKPATINRYMSSISGALRAAGEFFPALSEWRPPKAPWLPDPLGRDRLLSSEEIAKLLAALRSPRQKRERDISVEYRHEVHALFRLMLLTAAREGELLALNPRQVSWDWRTVQIDATKTKTRRVIPLSQSAFEIFQARKTHAPRFFRRLPKRGLYASLERAGEIAEIEYGDRVDGGWVLYDVRHVAATVMESAGVPYSAVAAILGHRRQDQTATYTHAQLETMRRGVEILEKHCREIDGFFLDCTVMQGTVQHSAKSARG